MRPTLDLLKSDRRARFFFLALTQSSLGTGAAYVALLALAYERFRSPWAISLVLLAEFLPAMFLGPVFGAAADRWSRRWSAVVGDLLRAVAFIGLGLVASFEATVGLALLAGAGTALFTPAVLAGLPSLVEQGRLPAATALYGATVDLGYTVGPALAAGVLLFVSPEALMIGNGVTFALSGAVVAGLRFGDRPKTGDPADGRRSLIREAWRGLRITAEMAAVRTVIVASGIVLLFAGMLNVAELPLAVEELGTSLAGFSALVAIFGAGFVAGSLTGARGGGMANLKRRYLAGALLVGLGLLGCGAAPNVPLAAVAFGIAGLGNGLLLVHERLLLQTSVADEFMGRVFGVKDASISWAFAVAFVLAGAILSVVGPRELLLLAGTLTIVIWAALLVSLRSEWTEDVARPGAGPPPPNQGVDALAESFEIRG